MGTPYSSRWRPKSTTKDERMSWLFFSLRFGFWLRLILPQQRKMIKWQWQTRTMSKIAVTIKINEKGIEWQVFGRHRFATSFEGLLDVCYVLRFQSEAWKFSQTLRKFFGSLLTKRFPPCITLRFFIYKIFNYNFKLSKKWQRFTFFGNKIF